MSKYRYVGINGKTLREHRVIWEDAYGKIPKGYDIHHKNGNPGDNRISNLMMLPHKDHMRLHYATFERTNGQWLKRCSCCKRLKPLADYYLRKQRNVKAKDSVLSECKPCNIKRALRNYYKRKGVRKNAG